MPTIAKCFAQIVTDVRATFNAERLGRIEGQEKQSALKRRGKMDEQNKHNLLYFEASTMKGLFAEMDNWQNMNHKRLLSINVQKDGEYFCCIALTNPTEVVITDSSGVNQVHIQSGSLWVMDQNLG